MSARALLIPEILRPPPKVIRKSQVKHGEVYCRRMTGLVSFVWHYGIGYRKGDRVGIIDWAGSRRKAGKIVSFREFSGGQEVHQILFPASGIFWGRSCRSPSRVVAKALEVLRTDPGSYSVHQRNCAQFVFFCKLRGYSSISQVPFYIGQSLLLPLA